MIPPPTSTNESPGNDTKPSDGEAQVMLQLWGMQSAPSMPLLPVPLWHGVIVPDRVLSMGQIEQFDHLNSLQKNDLC